MIIVGGQGGVAGIAGYGSDLLDAIGEDVEICRYCWQRIYDLNLVGRQRCMCLK